MTTLDINDVAGSLIAATGGVSAFYGYPGPHGKFPSQVCISVNDEVVHGVGYAERQIQFGDIVSIDCGIRLNGFIGDTARTVAVGPVSGDVAQLLSVTEQSLHDGIAAARGGNVVRDIGVAVSRTVEAAGFAIVREYVGHGVGVELHEPPEIPNYPSNRAKQRLRPGMVIAIEPMVNIGTPRVKTDKDGWTVRTQDGKWSAHFEHMVLITEGQAEILTIPEDI
jgi:methionyl aminopeptidase